MNYKNEIEKVAAFNLTKDKVKDGAKTVGKSVATGYLNGQGQELMSNIGAGIGIALSKAKGRSIPQAIARGGLAGMALGDLAGAATIPTYQLYRKHKKEFGEAPDAKSLATTLGVNVLPTAALWGGIYGLKNGKLRKQIASGMTEGISGLIDDVKGGAKALKAANGEGVAPIIKSTGKSAVKNLTKAGLAFAPVEVAGQLAALPTYIATPENIVKHKKKKLENARIQQQ